MRYALLSDIHANLEALEAVLGVLAHHQVDRYLGVGDLVGYGPDPVACLKRLRDGGLVSVAGNHDWACVGKMPVDWFNHYARQAIEWTRQQLGFADLDFLRRLPLTLTEGSLTLVHGTLSHPERFEYLVDAATALDTLHRAQTPLCIVGHTHLPVLLEWDTETRRILRLLHDPQALGDVELQTRAGRYRYLINPGSVGQPRDGDPRASVALYDAATDHLKVLRIPYEVAATQRKIRAAGLPAFLADRLAVGR